ncbi:prolyl oligopeptidase family serine peptidase [Bacillus sonorensis]|uniref:alpha/beta hydrolase family protein n=1 Tax=Bacillus sonorensis TaxID=119858 RepID=UPI0004959B7E|nr:prolyl oligopeptidase family serine peptidase [Bacillus sonorensis]MCY8033914.1 prolyl oligopeptidase family serine peptidase [Bacillus sonorensis]MCY8404061.1 prolyl oligopeptidase family serine peptidase [Bacillus sonorensis]MCY8563963.1 prolyl oligopeptidase family serine peptidase [Bacillus sonorensis]MEC1352507.1 prolyl oligopeptidase family serine peptidase [Bacillus sonorensis]MEC1427347.1 prolyl oligopeptidase family serine peptidase [Bacillus sonorensis]
MLLEKTRFPSPNKQIRLFTVTYLSQGLKVKGLLAEPAAPGRYDGFLYLRGGIKSVGMVRPGRIVQFAVQGFVVFAPYYRGNQGGEGNEDFAGDDREDAFAAFRFLQNHELVKDRRVHIFGFSRGGIMGILTAIQMKSAAASFVSWGGVSDMVLTYRERKDLRRMMKRVIGGTPEKVPQAYARRTPFDKIARIEAPVLLIHGAKDQNVSIEHARRFERELIKRNKPVETWYFHSFTHYFPPKENRRIVRELAQWMKSR